MTNPVKMYLFSLGIIANITCNEKPSVYVSEIWRDGYLSVG